MESVTERFAAWVQWLQVQAGGRVSQEHIARLIGCQQSKVSKILAGKGVRDVALAAGIERASADWPEGPILASEWAGDLASPAMGAA